MRPDAAASQLVAMDEETAAAILMKLDPRNSSVILNEMEPAKAARLTTTITGAAKTAPQGGSLSGQEKRS
jgi:flagellar motility protein MotE (MotC chaperone)